MYNTDEFKKISFQSYINIMKYLYFLFQSSNNHLVRSKHLKWEILLSTIDFFLKTPDTSNYCSQVYTFIVLKRLHVFCVEKTLLHFFSWKSVH